MYTIEELQTLADDARKHDSKVADLLQAEVDERTDAIRALFGRRRWWPSTGRIPEGTLFQPAFTPDKPEYRPDGKGYMTYRKVAARCEALPPLGSGGLFTEEHIDSIFVRWAGGFVEVAPGEPAVHTGTPTPDCGPGDGDALSALSFSRADVEEVAGHD